MDINSKYGIVKVFTDNIEPKALDQVKTVANSPLGEGAHIRIMPDCHYGKGCVIGTTMHITDKICPNLVGVDIACGVLYAKMSCDFGEYLEFLDEMIRRCIPYGFSVHRKETEIAKSFGFERLRCWEHLTPEVRNRAMMSLGTLGGGNHYIECYSGGRISIHTGSRNIGLSVCNHYQRLAKVTLAKSSKDEYDKLLLSLPATEREQMRQRLFNCTVDPSLSWLVGDNMDDYLHDCGIMNEFAKLNRSTILSIIVNEMNCEVLDTIDTVHNYVDPETRILRKGAVSAEKGVRLVIPLNMRDGILLCTGKGNFEWNHSAPHGAGRLYSRTSARKNFKLEDYQDAMKDVFSTSVCLGTIDECPSAYKDAAEIIQLIGDTVSIDEQIYPIYNFKAS